MSDQTIILYKEQIENNLKYLDVALKEKNEFAFIYQYNDLIDNMKEFIDTDPSSIGGLMFQNDLLFKFDQRKNLYRDIFKKEYGITLSYADGFKMTYI